MVLKFFGILVACVGGGRELSKTENDLIDSNQNFQFISCHYESVFKTISKLLLQ